MTKAVFVVTDLGPGDGGKGGVVHAVAKAQRAHTVVKRGGAQGSHGVRTATGSSFAFSQWGCGTFDGIPTHLSSQFIVSPLGLINEATALKDEAGVVDPFSVLTVDDTCLVATPFHGIASRLFELTRADHPRGTVGTGVGQAYRDFTRHPGIALRVSDLRAAGLRERLYAVRDHVHGYVWPVVEDAEFLRADSADVRHELELLGDDGFVEYTYEQFLLAGTLTRIVPHDYLASNILPKPGTVVVETSHGVLTDRVRGFHPHTSAIRTLPSFTRQILDDAGYEGRVINLGVTRAYAVRHGAGPMPTSDPAMAEHLLPGSNKDDNRYQGKVRVGPIDFVLLRYAIAASGGPEAFDGLAITWFDQVRANGRWDVCEAYEDPQDTRLYTPTGDIRVPLETSQEYQAGLCQSLLVQTPRITSATLNPDSDYDTLYGVVADRIQSSLGVPVRLVSFGPTERDKLMK
ncbi:MAG TPA: adenylosuccinate synthetase [Candidatus Saccharimonas sp.]|jgi:adenylosuccinate synthase|nr:adenylosuccinate synthetase [Candidatus Saccharimonas sp.]